MRRPRPPSVPPPRGRVLPASRRARDDRQRRLLPLHDPRFRLPALGLRHLRTRPYRPRTNGKAERFIRTLLGGWAYGAIYGTSRERTAALDGWLWTYNHRRPHGALSYKPPIARLNRLNNLPGSYEARGGQRVAQRLRPAACGRGIGQPVEVVQVARVGELAQADRDGQATGGPRRGHRALSPGGR